MAGQHMWRGGGMHGRVCMAGGICGRGHMWQGDVCARSVHGKGLSMTGDMPTSADGMHPTERHSCICKGFSGTGSF